MADPQTTDLPLGSRRDIAVLGNELITLKTIVHRIIDMPPEVFDFEPIARPHKPTKAEWRRSMKGCR